ncbi:hypothetical protein COB21_00390 [Candidatus Aerophobetes bacterium]|uniref:GYF domain-containing protein n=1 Tax=Aerophobetes bacterium TaxID=2030807 RepID=A0A2A4X8E0_UNCAE|nr:MAG: hypothetical protein COB21_00390 [Candidatus Aerophobetes bacterium]
MFFAYPILSNPLSGDPLTMENIFIFLIAYATFAFFASELAKKKNRPVLFWATMGFLFGVFALIVLAFLSRNKAAYKQPPKSFAPATTSSTTPPLNLSPDVWYYLDEKHQTKGPISFDRLKQLVFSSAIDRKAYVWHESMTDWQRINQNITLLKALLDTAVSKKELAKTK